LPEHSERLQVTAALIVRDDRVLITFRPSQALWEFPGGTLEPDETLEDCLAREIQEELNMGIKVERPFLSVDYNGEITMTLHTFVCRVRFGEPAGVPGETFVWAKKDHLSGYDFLPADKLVVKAIQEMDGFFPEAAGEIT